MYAGIDGELGEKLHGRLLRNRSVICYKKGPIDRDMQSLMESWENIYIADCLVIEELYA